MAEMREYVEHFIKQHALTQTELAQALGYKSRTSLVRIMDGNTRPKSVYDFERRMLERFLLTTEQERALHDAVTIAINGCETVHANQEMWRFIHGAPPSAAAIDPVWIQDMGSDARQDLGAHFANARNLRITMLNCQYVRIYRLLANMLRERDDVWIEHYILSSRNSAHTIHLINELLPMLCEERYQGYIREVESEDQRDVPMGISTADLMFCQYSLPSGEARKEVMIFHEPSGGIRVLCRGGLMILPSSAYRRSCISPSSAHTSIA